MISITNLGAKIIIATFNKNIQEAMHIIYKPPKTQISYFTCILETILKKIPINFSPIIIGDFNRYMSTKISQSTILHVATPLWPSVGVKPNTWKSWRFGVLWDSRMFRARQQGPKHLALRCHWCHWCH